MSAWTPGDEFRHPTMGPGRVVSAEPMRHGIGERLSVDFGGGELGFIVAGDAYVDEHSYRLEFNDALSRELARRAAREAVKAAETGDAPAFDAGTLRDVLARPAPPPMRAEGLVPHDAGALIVAQRKTGKSVYGLNWARSLLTGDPFLGRFPVIPIEGTVALLNYEVSGHTIARWAHDHDVPQDRLYMVNLRGRRNPLSNPQDREMLARDLRERGTESVIVDPFGRAFSGASQNDSGEVGSWLTDLDVFCRGEVGASDVMLTAHAGWNGERSRGSSALEDWADVIVWLTRDGDDDSKRFLRAEGRDVLVEEDGLLFDEVTRTLTMAGTGSRKTTKDTRKSAELGVYVVRAARDSPGLSYSAAESAIRAMDDAPRFRNGEVAHAARYAAAQGQLLIGTGARGAASLTAVEVPNV